MPTQWRKSPYVVRLNSRRLSTGPSKAKRQAYYDGLTKPLSEAIILALFGNGEQGAYYDPYDLTDEKLDWVAANPSFTSAQFMAAFPNHTLFQDSLGTIPVTGNMQPLGLGLDKRFGGVRGENFWTLGDITVTEPVNAFSSMGGFTSNAGLLPNTLYEISYKANITGGAVHLKFLDEPNRYTTAQNVRLILYTGTIINDRAFFQPSTSSVTGTITNIQIRPILGNHAHQPVSAARPLWQNNGGLKSFWFDGLDDHLLTTCQAGSYDNTSVFVGYNTADKIGYLYHSDGTQTNTASMALAYLITATGADNNVTSGGSNIFTAAPNNPRIAFNSFSKSPLEGIVSLDGLSRAAVFNMPRNSTHVLTIGCRTPDSPNIFYQGRIYSLIIRSVLTPEAQAEPIRQLLATRSGVTL